MNKKRCRFVHIKKLSFLQNFELGSSATVVQTTLSYKIIHTGTAEVFTLHCSEEETGYPCDRSLHQP